MCPMNKLLLLPVFAFLAAVAVAQQADQVGERPADRYGNPDAARAEARRLTDETIALLSGIPGSEFLCGLAEYLLEREN